MVTTNWNASIRPIRWAVRRVRSALSTYRQAMVTAAYQSERYPKPTSGPKPVLSSVPGARTQSIVMPRATHTRNSR